MTGDEPHPYGPTLAYLESQISGDPDEYFDTVHSWVGFALDDPQHERQYDWEQYYPIEEGMDGKPIPKHKWKDVSEEEKSHYELLKVSHGESVFTQRIIDNTDEEKPLYVSIRIATLVRMGVFRLIKQDEGEEELTQRIIVPKWTRDWYEKRVGDGPHTELDQSFARDCIKAMWFIGEEWELLYSMRDMHNSVLKTKFESRAEIWSRMQKRHSYRTKEGKESQRVGSVLRMLLRAGLVEEGDGGLRKIDKVCEPFRSDWCPIKEAERMHRGETLDWALATGRIDEQKYYHLQMEIFSNWAIASTHQESHTSTTKGDRVMASANTSMFNQAVCKIQEAIWSGKYGEHYQGSASRKKNPHPLDCTKWPLFRISDLSEKNSPDWWHPSTSWELIDLGKIKKEGITNQPRRQIWSGKGWDKESETNATVKPANIYRPKVRQLLELQEDEELIINQKNDWGGSRNAFRFITLLERLKKEGVPLEELRTMVTEYSVTDWNMKDMWKSDPNRPPFTYPDSFEPYEWQNEASEKWWKGNQQGIIEVVTGAGKTVLAIKLIKEFLELDNKNKALIIVPTEVLLNQWCSELSKFLNLTDEQVSLIGDNNYGSLSENNGTRVAVGIVNSLSLEHVRERFNDEGMPDPGNLFVIADECHRYRGEKFRRALEWYIRVGDSKLGLSATPLAKKDDVDVGDESDEDAKLIVQGFLGDVIFHYGYVDAEADDLIPKFRVKLVRFELTAAERKRYHEYSKRISRSRQKIVDAVGHRLDRMRGSFEAKVNKLQSDGMKIPGVRDYFEAIRDRKDLLSHGLDGLGLTNRQKCFEHILRRVLSEDGKPTGKKVLVFQERISQIQDSMYPSGGNIRNMLDTGYFRPSSVHSRRAYPYRNEMSLDLLRTEQGVVNAIFSAKQLDEGLDVPAVDAGIIRIPTSSLRTMIQRLGRTLRKMEGKEKSDFYVLYAGETTETRFFENEEFKVRVPPDVLQDRVWDPTAELPKDRLRKPDPNNPDEEVKWGSPKLDIQWDQLTPRDAVRGRVEGGQFSVSSEWIPFVKQRVENGRDIRVRITNPDYVEVASVLREMNKPGAVYHDQDGHCVTYQRGKGGTYVGDIDPNQEIVLEEYPVTRQARRARPLIHVQEGSNIDRILKMLSPDEEE